MRRGAATMVPVSEQLTDDERSGRGTRTRRNLAQRLADMQREMTELKWGGVKEAALTIQTVVEALDGEERTRLEHIHGQIIELLRDNGMVEGATE
jgi:hypothetical protein